MLYSNKVNTTRYKLSQTIIATAGGSFGPDRRSEGEQVPDHVDPFDPAQISEYEQGSDHAAAAHTVVEHTVAAGTAAEDTLQ